MTMLRSATTLLIAFSMLVTSAPDAVADDTAYGLSNQPIDIKVTIDNRSDLEKLTRLVSIDHVRGREVSAVATPAQLERLDASGYRWQTVTRSVSPKDIEMCVEGWVTDSDRSWDCYPTYDQYRRLMDEFAFSHPQLCRLVDLGPTTNAVRPHRLLAIVISDNPDNDENEPEVLLTSTMHGDETVGFLLMLRLIDALLEGYGSDDDVTELVDSSEIWINPNANPDGTYFSSDDSVADAIRYYTTADGRSSGVDPNRNFPDPGLDGGPPSNCAPECWAETQHMIALAEAKQFVLSANLHGGAEVINFPWDSTARRHPDDAWLYELSRDWADLAQSDSPAGYMTDLDNGVTNGWDWYPTIGSRQDFMTFYRGSREVTAEVSNTKLPPSDGLEDFWLWNRRALLDFIAHAHQGIRGVITDAAGAPLDAEVEIIGVDRAEDGSTVRTDPAVGDYHRLLLPGVYDLRFTAYGYRAVEVFGVAVVEDEATVVDATLDRERVRRPRGRIAPVGRQERLLQLQP